MILGVSNYQSEHAQAELNAKILDIQEQIDALKAVRLGASQSISSLTELTSLSHNDVFPITDTANAQTKKLKWGTATATLKTLFDTKYTALFTDSAGLASILSDETGSSGGFVRAGSPTISSPSISSPIITSLSSLSVGSDATGDVYYRSSGGLFTRLPFSSGKVLWASSTTGIPEWNNNAILINPMTSSSTFVATTTHAGSTLFTGSQGSQYGGVSIGSNVSATSSGNLLVQGTASTTNLNISGGYFTGWASSTAYEIVSNTDTLNFNTTDWVDTTVTCSAGKIVVGGGYIQTTAGNQSGHSTQGSGPVGNNSWRVIMKSSAGVAADTITIYAICVRQ